MAEGTLQAGIWPIQRTDYCLCAVMDAAHRYSEGLADYNPESIFCSLARNVYHYPPLVIMAESQPWLYFQCKESLEAKPAPISVCGFPVIFLDDISVPHPAMEAGFACHGACIFTLLLTGTYL